MSDGRWCDVRADGYTIERTALGPSMLWSGCRLDVAAMYDPAAVLPTVIPDMRRLLVEYAAKDGMTVDWPSVVWSVERSDDLVPAASPPAWVAP